MSTSLYPSLHKHSLSLPLESGITAADYTGQYWRSLYYFNCFRFAIGSGLLIVSWQSEFASLGSYHYQLFLYAGISHVLFSGLFMLLIRLRLPGFNRQLAIQVISDIAFFSLMLYASGGLQSGLGVLLLVSLAGAGLVSRGRLALFFASIATISLLLQETYSLWTIDHYAAQYSQAGLLSMAYFAVAWLAHRLAKYTLASEQLAKERGIDLANMAQVNQLVIQDLQEGVLVVDQYGYIRQRNAYAERLFDLNSSADKAERLKLSDCIPELANRLTSWQGDSSISFDLLRLAHSNALVRTRFLPIQADFRNGVVIFLEDMGRIQAQLQQLKLAALGRLTANIAHEIRNPLSAINHAAELLEEEQLESNTDPRLVRIICDNTRRLNKIVQDVLQLNRRNSAKPDLIDLHEFMGKFLEEFCHAERMDRNVFVLKNSSHRWVSFDRDHLNQVLWNLCRNAWRHCCKQADSVRIELSVAANENNVYLDIVDDGPGIDPQQVKQIFEPFFTTAAGGTGLGLYIARELCETNQASLDYIEGSSGGHFRIICQSNQSCL
ncbi:two-component system sensor histidine kinase PilS (NtrC family) [Nitrosomonas oligotropha]|uniref:histidine kinase n=2 Tax=Nitrosomonas oligotropha TaxID=42354 RepID=A0A2T5HIM3_9PROT|nr:two-component system sensor histidine kinase PilS (NtrC family) [Nitrosomonas oligotropha]